MKMHGHSKVKGPSRVSNQQHIFELKQRVVLALNKLADRDTYQIGVEELEKIIECLTPDGISPFLSCILDTDSEQKSAVRKECIRLMGKLADFHEGLISPFLGKIIASIVKRLKDSDSVVRDACVETVGILASKLSTREGGSDGVFLTLVKPLFEALGEQNKHVQSGSALCLARIIDRINDPPVSILQRMLSRTIKLLKNPHFMAKPAVIELNKSIIRVGGAPTQSTLSAALNSIQDALKNSDWTTRKAASSSLGELAANGGPFLYSFKASCLQSLESCRFDKVKPVRDMVLQALHLWKGLPGPDAVEPSEAGSCIKENFSGVEYADSVSPSDSTSKDITQARVGIDSVKRRIPLSARKVGHNYVENPPCSKQNDWHVEIAVPRTQHVTLADKHNEESEGSSVTKTFERISAEVTSNQDNGYEYVPMDDKQECSSVANITTNNYEAKLVAVSDGDFEDGNLLKLMGRKQLFAAEETSSEEQRNLIKMRNRRSLESTVTEMSSQNMHGCCAQTADEVASIRNQLAEIEKKQSNLMDLLKAYATSTIDSLSVIQLKVSSLEHVVDRLAQDLVHGGKYNDPATAKLLRRSPSIVSPRISTCTPRPSLDIRNRPPPSSATKNTKVWEENTSRSSSLTHQSDMWSDNKIKQGRIRIGKDTLKFSGQEIYDGQGQLAKFDSAFGTAANTGSRQNSLEVKNSLWLLVKGYLSEGDIESAFVEALSSDDELVLMELLDRTGPVLECLSHRTASDVLSTLASYFLEQRFIKSIIPWLQQVVDLCAIHGPNYLVLSSKARREFLSAIQAAANMEFSSPADIQYVRQLATKLHQIWGKCSS